MNSTEKRRKHKKILKQKPYRKLRTKPSSIETKAKRMEKK